MICGLCNTNPSDGSGLCPSCRGTLPESHHLSTKQKNKSSTSYQYAGQTNSGGGGLMAGFGAFVAFVAMMIGSSE